MNNLISSYITVSSTECHISDTTPLVGSGYNFTTNGPVTLYFIGPSGIPTTLDKVADGTGYYYHEYYAHSGAALGRWEYYAVDETTRISSQSVFIDY